MKSRVLGRKCRFSMDTSNEHISWPATLCLMDNDRRFVTAQAGPRRDEVVAAREVGRARRAAWMVAAAVRCGDVIHSPWWSSKMMVEIGEQARGTATTHLRWHWLKVGGRRFWPTPEIELGAFLEALTARSRAPIWQRWSLSLGGGRGDGDPLGGVAWFLSGGNYRDRGYRGRERDQALTLVWGILDLERRVGGVRDLLEMGVGLDSGVDYLEVVSRVLTTLESLCGLGVPGLTLAREIGGRAKLSSLDELFSLVAVTLY